MPRNDQVTRQWFLLQALEKPGGATIDVELRFDRKTSAWAKGRIWHPSQKAALGKDGCLRLRLQVADTPELVGWILSFGAGVRVTKPAELTQRLKSTATQIANQG